VCPEEAAITIIVTSKIRVCQGDERGWGRRGIEAGNTGKCRLRERGRWMGEGAIDCRPCGIKMQGR
jgi:hypothetical protein